MCNCSAASHHRDVVDRILSSADFPLPVGPEALPAHRREYPDRHHAMHIHVLGPSQPPLQVPINAYPQPDETDHMKPLQTFLRPMILMGLNPMHIPMPRPMQTTRSVLSIKSPNKKTRVTPGCRTHEQRIISLQVPPPSLLDAF